ncbi:MAG: hypothetical protein IPI57_12880, partial [Candidatus Competibacteraceae bacterium]|nr:hypothetical protein [Candidatus Competibacteraceae bacterium]
CRRRPPARDCSINCSWSLHRNGAFSRVVPLEFSPCSGRRVLKARDYLAYAEAEAIAEAARRQADALRVEAGRFCEAEKQRGYQDGQ